MLNTVIMTFVCIFSVYGFISFLGLIGAGFLSKGEKPFAHTVVFLQKGLDRAEGQIRSVIWEQKLTGFFENRDIIAVYAENDKVTLRVLRKLEEEYGNLRVLKKEEYIRLVEEWQNGENIGNN